MMPTEYRLVAESQEHERLQTSDVNKQTGLRLIMRTGGIIMTDYTLSVEPR
jgi:hypothetical protein